MNTDHISRLIIFLHDLFVAEDSGRPYHAEYLNLATGWQAKEGFFFDIGCSYRVVYEPPEPREWWGTLNSSGQPLHMFASRESAENGCRPTDEVVPVKEMLH